MKARLAKKILLGSEKKKRYWTKRVIKASFGWKSCESTSNLSSQEKKKGGKP